MDVFITGQLAQVSSSFCDKLTNYNRIVASSRDINMDYIGNTYKKFNYTAGEEAFERLFHIYSFDVVVFFVKRPELGEEAFHELRDLDIVLSLCNKNDVSKVILVSSTYLYHGIPNASEETIVSPTDSETLRLWSCEKLCDLYSYKCGLSVLKLHTPCLFGTFENQSMIGRMVHQAALKNYIHIEGEKNQTFDFLSLEDLGELVSRILSQWPDTITTLNLSGASSMTLEQLGSSFNGIVANTRVTYSDKPIAECPPLNSSLARGEYDWLPVIELTQEIPLLVRHIYKGDTKGTTLREKIRSLVTSKNTIIKTIEMILCYFLMEYLNSVTETAVQFRYVDFRLLFVVLIAIVHGLNFGVFASLLASFSFIMSAMSSGIDWRVLIYNINNWLPFVCYIIAGAVIGYTKDKKEADLKFVTDEKEILEKRHAFLNELYNSSLQSKNQYKKQIMSYRNSFGRLFEATRRLNTLTPDVVFKEALFILEDILDNQSICIYSVTPNLRFARLKVCSKKVLDSVPKSIDLEEYSDITAGFTAGEVWVNTSCQPNCPDYVFPIFCDDKLNSLILVTKASYDQMALYFENLLKILCNLIEDTLVRAQKYTDEFGEDEYIPGSTVLKKEAFKKILAIREQMAQESIAEYSMIGIDADSGNIADTAARIRKYFRESDIFGQGDDGKLYIVLSQANKETTDRIVNRLKSVGLLQL